MTSWRKSSYSGGGGGTTECVEVAKISGVGGTPDGVGQSSALVSERIEGRRISTI
ncbi:DUF397 domain-containing protein [Actinoallomurus acanthiterrae]